MAAGNDRPGRRVVLVAALAALVVAVLAFASPGQAQASPEVPGLTGPPWGAWHTEQVDGEIARPDALAFTSSGEPRIAYERAYNGVRFAEPIATGWDSELIETQAGDVSLAIDESDRAWLGYVEAFPVPSEIQLAWRDAGKEAWTIEIVDEGVEPVMDLGPSGTPYFIYKGITEHRYELRHAERVGPGEYSSEVITDASKEGTFFYDSAFAIAEDGTQHALFTQPNDAPSQIRYAVHNPATDAWSFRWLEMCQYGAAHDLALGPEGDVHVACHHDAHGLIHYHKPADGGSWSWSVAATGEDVVPPRPDDRMGKAVAIAAGPDNVHMTWRTNFNGFCPDCPTTPMHLYYTAGSGGEYSTEPVNNRGTGIGGDSSVTVDGEGRPWVLYEHNWRAQTLPREEVVNPGHALWLAHPASGLGDRTVRGVS